MLFGDFNYPAIDWSTGTLHRFDVNSDNFLNFYNSNNLFQIVNVPTRYRVENTPALLDLTTDKTLITDIKYGEPVGKSGHITTIVN